MNADQIELRGRNARLRAKIEEVLPNASDAAKDAVREIIAQLSSFPVGDSPEFLEHINGNLLRRMDALIRHGAATPADFEGLVWPPHQFS